jgi:hypothetical protein
MATIDEEARQLAEKHYELEEGMQQIIQLKQEVRAQVQPAGDYKEKIGLLEVNEYTVPSGIMPLEFAPVPESGVTYPTMIVEVTPEEFEIRENSGAATATRKRSCRRSFDQKWRSWNGRGKRTRSSGQL